MKIELCDKSSQGVYGVLRHGIWLPERLTRIMDHVDKAGGDVRGINAICTYLDVRKMKEDEAF